MMRYDVTTQDWVIFAPSRALRPHQFKRGSEVRVEVPTGPERPCPFCPGNEQMTPPEITAVREGTAPNTPGWRVRVTPNKYPALRIEEANGRREEGPLFRAMGGCGAHEVIIETPDHNLPPALQPPEHLALILRVLQDRDNDLMRDARFQTIVIFKNHGVEAGTSLVHPHWQLIATPVVPSTLRRKHAIATQYFDQTGRCLYCALVEDELTAGTRVLVETPHFVAVLPYASHTPFETWILPKHHQSSFRWVDPSMMRPLAEVLKTVLAKLRVGLGDPAFNLTINTVSRGDEDQSFFLWHLQIVPRLTTPAGFELGSGMAINTMLPEDAAEYLRGVAE
jgi:UDPglucose--hexose-1-phosphate uridylyltransferase